MGQRVLLVQQEHKVCVVPLGLVVSREAWATRAYREIQGPRGSMARPVPQVLLEQLVLQALPAQQGWAA